MVRILTLFVFLFGIHALPAQTAAEYYAMAKRAKTSFDYRGAEKMMSQAIKMDPENIEFLVFRGNLYLGLEKDKQARRDFEAAMAIDSMEVDPWIGRSRYFLYTSMIDSALHDTEVAFILAESAYGEAKANSALGEVLMTAGKDSAAMRHFEVGLTLDTTNTRALKNMAALKIKHGDFADAKQRLKRALEQDSRDLETLINLAYASNKLEEYTDAVDYANRALSLDNHQPLALSNRAYAYLHLNEVEAAGESIDASLKNDPRNALAHRYKAEILVAQKATRDEVCKSLKKAHKFGYAEIYDDRVDRMMDEYCR